MAIRHYYYGTSGYVEITSRVQRMSWQSTANAEEASVGMWEVVIADPAMDLDIVGHRKYLIVEDESEAADDVIFYGYTGGQKISRGASNGETFEPLGRTWSVQVSDANTVFSRRIMTGADCKRPAETDVERMQWLLATNEAGSFDDVTSFVSTASGVAMDKADYRGQTFYQVADDCAQASGKNWFATFRKTTGTRKLTAWYGNEALDTYTSPLMLSNDPADWVDSALADGTSLVWPVLEDATIDRDPSRVYWAVYLTYDGGAIYRTRAATATAYAKRDFSAPSVNVKSKAKAIARATRYLNDLDDQEVRITATVELPKGKATMLREGMLVPIRLTWGTDGIDEGWMCRVLNSTIVPVAAGSRYRNTVTLSTSKQGEFTGSAFAGLLLYQTSFSTNGFHGTGDVPPGGWFAEPTVGPCFSFAESSDPWISINVLRDCTVRVEAKASWGTVINGSVSVSMSTVIMRGGSPITIATDTVSSGPGGLRVWGADCSVDTYGVSLHAGDQVRISTSSPDEESWTNQLGTDGNYLRVGRGTFVWKSGAVTWTGY